MARMTPNELATVAEELDNENTEAISIRMPKDMLMIIKEFANRQGIGYQVLMKQWLDDRVKTEAKKFLYEKIRTGGI